MSNKKILELILKTSGFTRKRYICIPKSDGAVEYLVCKKEHQVGNSIILVGRKYKIVCIINRGLSINTYGEFEKLIYMKSDLIDINIPYRGSAIYLSSFKNSSYTDLYIDDYFVDVSEVREEKLKELGI